MLGRRFGLGLFVVVVLVLSLVAGPSGAQESGDEEVPTVLPSVPREVGDRLPEPGDLQQRHPWVPNDAPWPWNMSIAQGSWTNSNRSVTLVHCGPTVASDNPYWYQENMLYTRWTGGARCNVQMAAITGSARLYQHNGYTSNTTLLAEAAIGTQHAVPEGHGSGWQAYSEAYYTRTREAQNLQIHLRVTLEIQPWGTGARWNTVPNSCTRDANIRIIHCELWSVPFRNAPYACPNPSVGIQPVCTRPPTAQELEEEHAPGSYVPDTPEVPDVDAPNHDDPVGLYRPDDDPYGTNPATPDEEGFPSPARVSDHAGNMQCIFKPRPPQRSSGLGPYTVKGHATQICDPPVGRQYITACVEYRNVGNEQWYGFDCKSRSKTGAGAIHAYPGGPCTGRRLYRTSMFGEIIRPNGQRFVSPYRKTKPVAIRC